MHENNFGFKSLLPCQISFAIDGEKVIREKLLMEFFFQKLRKLSVRRFCWRPLKIERYSVIIKLDSCNLFVMEIALPEEGSYLFFFLQKK